MIPLVTVANRGYLDLLVNFYNTLKVAAPHRLKQLVIVTYDQDLIKDVKLTHQDIAQHISYLQYPSLTVKRGYTLEGRPVVSDAIPFGKGYWNLVTRYKLLAIWSLLNSPANANKAVFYCDPDIAFVRDPFEGLPTETSQTLLIQQGNPYCSGVIYVPNIPVYQRLFNPATWSNSKLNDEEYLTQQMKTNHIPVDVLDFETFPNGLVWDVKDKAEQLIVSKRCVLFHFNFIQTIERKIQKMKELRLFF